MEEGGRREGESGDCIYEATLCLIFLSGRAVLEMHGGYVMLGGKGFKRKLEQGEAKDVENGNGRDMFEGRTA